MSGITTYVKKGLQINGYNSIGLSYLSANILNLALALVNFKLLTNVLHGEYLAEYSLLNAFQSFGTLLLTGPLRVALVRFFSSALVDKLQYQFERFALYSMSLSAFVMIVLGTGFSKYLGFSTTNQIVGVTLIVLYGVLMDYASFLAGCSIRLGNVRMAIIRIIIGKLAFTVGILFSCLITNSPTATMILAISVAALILLLLCTSNTRLHFPVSIKQYYIGFSKMIFSFGWIFVLTGLITWAQSSLPRFFISWSYSIDDVSKFFIISQIASLSIAGFSATLNQYVSPRLFKQYDQEPNNIPSPSQEIITNGSLLMIGIAILGVTASFLCGNWIVALLSKKGIVNIALDLALSFLIYGLFSAAQVQRLYGDQLKMPRKYFWVNIIYPCSAVVFAYIGAKINFHSIFVGLLVGEIIHLGGVYIVNQKLYKSRLSHGAVLS